MYSELYYWMCYYTQKRKKNKTPYFTALLILSLLLLLNLTTLFITISYIYNVIGSFKQIIHTYSLYLFFLFFLFNYIVLYKRRKEISMKYDALTLKRKLKGRICFWLFFIFTFILLFILDPILLKQ